MSKDPKDHRLLGVDPTIRHVCRNAVYASRLLPTPSVGNTIAVVYQGLTIVRNDKLSKRRVRVAVKFWKI